MPRKSSSKSNNTRNTGGSTAGPARRNTAAAKLKDRAQPPSIRGEKRVKATGASLPVGPSPRRRGTHDGPTDPAAIDRRREFTGTDQPADPTPGKPAKRRRGGGGGGGGSGSAGKSGNDEGGGGIGPPAYT